MFRAETILDKKSTLFGMVFACVLGSLTIPIIIPHAFHGYHILHILLHVAGITLSSFLTVISLVAFYRLGTKRMMFTVIAFSLFVVAESVALVETTWPELYSLGMLSLLETGHLLVFLSMGLLAMGVFRND